MKNLKTYELFEKKGTIPKEGDTAYWQNDMGVWMPALVGRITGMKAHVTVARDHILVDLADLKSENPNKKKK